MYRKSVVGCASERGTKMLPTTNRIMSSGMLMPRMTGRLLCFIRRLYSYLLTPETACGYTRNRSSELVHRSILCAPMKILMAISGGVDSAVAAHMLARQGH